MSELTFYDATPFEYGYSSKDEIIANMNPLLKELMEQNLGKVFCDIGCGCGRNLVYASDFAARLIGVDLSRESLAFAKNFVKSDKLELKQGDNLDIPLNSEIADIVVSDGVCHHTGDTVKAFSECVRILKSGGKLYLAVYKKFRYYPFVYYVIGGLFRVINKVKLGNYILESVFIRAHYLMYKMFKKQKLSKTETRNIFYDYFITPVATFQSKSDVNIWCNANNCNVIDYARTSGNCHVFIIQKND
ncbi:MAG: class I SAM-dependent methyltransferase [Bacteroidota bacterium]|nr:class I SAM-dependent methyltransferase [Bacteroidota bacterium]